MKHNISLSLKTTLLTALPCLALSLFAVSCSDDDSAVVQEKTTKGKTISFTAAAPKITEYTTRVGLDETNLPFSGADSEPVIWLDGDALAFNFVKYGEQTGKVIKFTVSSDGATYRYTTDEELDVENGLYEVYVVGPKLPTTFQGDALSGTTVDLRDQSQPQPTNFYKNLTDYYYQHAFTVLRLEDNKVTWGSTHLTFTGLTSMLRYRITNNLTDYQVKVVKINISKVGEASQFYTRGTFDSYSGTSIETMGNPVSTLGLTTAHTLNPSEQFNAYMTLIPTEGFTSLTQFTTTVYFYIGNILYKRIWTWDSTQISNGAFPADSRFLFGLTLRPGEYEMAALWELDDEEEEELPDENDSNFMNDLVANGTTYTPITWENFLISPIEYMLTLTDHKTHNGSNYLEAVSGPNSLCPQGWEILTYNHIRGFSATKRLNLLQEIDYSYGYIAPRIFVGDTFRGDQWVLPSTDGNGYLTNMGNFYIQHLNPDGSDLYHGNVVLYEGWLDYRCMKALY